MARNSNNYWSSYQRHIQLTHNTIYNWHITWSTIMLCVSCMLYLCLPFNNYVTFGENQIFMRNNWHIFQEWIMGEKKHNLSGPLIVRCKNNICTCMGRDSNAIRYWSLNASSQVLNLLSLLYNYSHCTNSTDDIHNYMPFYALLYFKPSHVYTNEGGTGENCVSVCACNLNTQCLGLSQEMY